MAKTEALTEESPAEEVVDESIVDKIFNLFQSNEASIDYGADPQGWVDENLPEGTEAADVAEAMPEVCGKLGGPYQANAARYNAGHGAHAQAATHSVVNEISYTYNTVYQQNAFIYAEEGAQVVNIQGDGNSVDQTQIDVDFDVDVDTYPEDEYEDPKDMGDEDPMDPEDPELELPEDEDSEDEDDTDTDTDTDTGDYEDPYAEGDEPPTAEEDPWTPDGDPVEDPTDDGWDPTDGSEDAGEFLDPVEGTGYVPDPVDPPADAPEAANPFDGAEEMMG